MRLKIVVLLLLFSTSIFASFQKKNPLEITAIVTKVKDGDTIEILYYELPMVVRLNHIDAPETRGGQPFSKAAKAQLMQWCLGKKVKIKTEPNYDRNGRLIGEIFSMDGKNINQLLVKEGYAWHYQKYSDNEEYAHLQEKAKKEKKGLWVDKNPVAPWNFRKK